MNENFDDNQQDKPHKKIKIDKQQWIVVEGKKTPLVISIANHNKINRCYSHISIQKYLCYLLTGACPNPMWLSIKRQSQIQYIIFIDWEVQSHLLSSVQNKLKWLHTMINPTNTAIFKNCPCVRDELWQRLLCYSTKQHLPNYQHLQQQLHKSGQFTQQLLHHYEQYLLTNTQLQGNLYPKYQLPLYKQFLIIEGSDQINLKNLLLVIDCEMVTTQMGFELARTTICNYAGLIIFDEFFKPKNPILNYNTAYSGITEEILTPITNTIQNTLYPFLLKNICKKTIMVGHSLENDLFAMKCIYRRIIDTSVLFQRKNGGKIKLKNLAKQILNINIQTQTHDSKQDCLATLRIAQVKIEHSQKCKAKQYNLLTDVINAKKSILIIDYNIQELRQYNAIHFEKTAQKCCSTAILNKLQQYFTPQNRKPDLALTRIEHNDDITNWDKYYSQFDSGIQKLYQHCPKGMVIFINCQINTNIQIILNDQKLVPDSANRPYCLIIVKN